MKHVKENNPTNRPLPQVPTSDPLCTNGGPPLEQPYPPSPPEDTLYQPQSPIGPPAQQYHYSPPERQIPRAGNNYQYQQVSPLPPTMEEDMRQNNNPNNRRRHEPRYISNPRNQLAAGGGRYNLVQRPVVRNGMFVNNYQFH